MTFHGLIYQFRVVNEGLSSKAVRLPTSIALYSARILCTYMEVSGVDNTAGLPSCRKRSIKPSADWAHFKVIYGRLRIFKVTKRRISSRHSSSSTPTVTSIPASSSFRMPRPATRGNGSMQPTTTLGIPLLTIKSAQGGVFP